MNFTNRQFNNGERPAQAFRGNGVQKYFYLRLGIVEDIDLDKYEMVITWKNGPGLRPRIPISFPYMGPAGCMGALPEKGAIGIFMFYNEGGGEGKGAPLCLAYLPSGLGTAIDHNVVKILPDVIPTDAVNEILHRHRKLNKGDMIVTSPLGATSFLNEDVEFHDNNHDTLLIRDGDQSIIMNSINNFLFADGVAVSSGPAIRNNLVVYDKNGKKIPYRNGSIYTLPNGKQNIYLVPHGDEIRYDTQFYSEYRLDVDDLVDRKLDVNEMIQDSGMSTRDPIVTMALGNYVGADPKNPQQYGYLLKPNIFTSATDKVGQFSLNWAVQNNGLDEPSCLGLAYALHFLKTGCFIGVDKEGHYFWNLPASRSNPLGTGRSMSILAAGNLKEVWGPANSDYNSWDLTAKGGIRWDVGAHNASGKGRSIEITTDKSLYLNIGGEDDDGFAKQEIVIGNIKETCSGDKTEDLSNLRVSIKGMKKESITGSASESVQSNKTISVQGVFAEIAVTEKQCKFGKRNTTILIGNDELTVLKGDITETIVTFGNKKTMVTTGNIEDFIIAGERKTTVGAGSYKVGVSAGVIEIKTLAGTVEISGTVVNVTGTLMVNIDAPIVRVGKNAPFGGAITGLPGIPSHFDPITGTPGKGSMSVGIA